MDEKYMKLALLQAKKAYKNGEIPVGAVIVKDGEVISTGYNCREKCQNALLHAEIVAINKACKKLNSFRLDGCNMYVTLEPCAMCSGAIVNARLKMVYYGAKDDHYGCAGSLYDLLSDKHFEHKVVVKCDIQKSECENLLKRFFCEVRIQNKLKKLIGTSPEYTIKEQYKDYFSCEIVFDKKTFGGYILGDSKENPKVLCLVKKGINTYVVMSNKDYSADDIVKVLKLKGQTKIVFAKDNITLVKSK